MIDPRKIPNLAELRAEIIRMKSEIDMEINITQLIEELTLSEIVGRPVRIKQSN